MLPTINGKPLLECHEEDLHQILNNPDYRENEHLDYKQSFSILEYPKDKQREKSSAKSEFRSDVCSFANANSGYLIYGIQEDGKGIPAKITGVTIPEGNIDKFEINIKNWLQTIRPRMPSIDIRFVSLSSGLYVVILFVKHDSFVPYIFLEDEKNYRIYKRAGNSKIPIEYSEMKSMFSQSIVIDKEIQKYRTNRVDWFWSQTQSNEDKKPQFILLHIIPETFLDSNYNQPLFALEKKRQFSRAIFDSFNCNSPSIPTVEGLCYRSYHTRAECLLYNNGIAEIFYPVESDLNICSDFPNGLFPVKDLWDKSEEVFNKYIHSFANSFAINKLYVGFSVIGCKNVKTEINNGMVLSGAIDRERLIMNTFVVEDTNTSGNLDISLKRMKLDYMLALGIKYNREIEDLIKDVYGE